MISITGYTIREVLFKDPSKMLLRAERVTDAMKVLLKVPLHQEPARIKEMDYELTIRSHFESESVVTVSDRLNIEHVVLLEMEDFEGIPLNTYLARNRPSPADCLRIAVQLARLVEELHGQSILHRDIRPANFLINTDTLALKMWDLGFAASATSPGKGTSLERKLEFALEYISPEQSGRMNMEEDERSDLYSLGITLYQLFTGRLPFEQTDINELVHSHMAKQPVSPATVDPALPVVISDMIVKLLQKKPTERYQSARSLRFDLKECCHQYPVYGNVHPFVPDRYMLADTLQFHTHLYGRDVEIERILAAFGRIHRKSEFVLFYGNSGIGKSAVMHEVHQRLQRKDILFLSGKCDERNQNIPFGIIVQAFRELIPVLRENRYWHEAVLEAVGPAVHILTDIIPALESVFGTHAPAPELPPADAQKRMAITFTKFLEAVAAQARPLVIFLDDLQWADAASIRLLQILIASPDTKNMLIVGAYRDNEIHDHHPLAVLLQSVNHALDNFQHRRLSPLSPDDVSELLADMLASSTYATRPLADYLITGTLGNPLFISERIQELYKKSLIAFDRTLQRWNWSIEDIVQYAGMSSSLELITTRIQRLPKTTQQALVYGACIGRQFDLSVLAALMDKTDHEAADELKEALRENLILAAAAPASKDAKTLLPKTRYQFFHDQVQQAACLLIPLREQQELHRNIGYFLLDKLSTTEIENQLFEIVNHLNPGSAFVTDAREKSNLAMLNLRAGRKAKYATAYGAAYTYFHSGLALLNEASWHTEYDLCLSLHSDGAEAAYLSHHTATSDALVALTLRKAKTNLEKACIHLVQIRSLVFQRRNNDAIALALQVLKSLQITFPASPSTFHLLLDYARIKWILRRKKIEALESLAEMRDARMLTAMRIIHSITAAAYQTMPDLYPLLVLKMTRLSVKYGNTTESPLAYCTYGAMVNAIETNNGACYRFGATAVNMLQHISDIGIRERTLLIYNLINRLSQESVHGSLDELKRCYKRGIELGDVEYAAYTSNAYCMLLCLSGKNLWWIKDEMLRCNMLPNALRIDETTNGNDALIQFIANLTQESADPKILTGDYFQEETGFVEILSSSTPSKLFTCYVFKMMLCYLLEDYQQGLKNVAIAKTYLNFSKGMILEPVFYFYASLLNLTQHGQAPDTKNLRHGRGYKNQLKKWADQVPVNYAHLYFLVEAEHARVSGRKDFAPDLYDRAIQRAQENNYLHDEALAHELAAKCWHEKGQKHNARVYLASAIDAYKKWGCALKVKHLENHNVLQKRNNEPELYLHEIQKLSGPITPSIDMATVLKASTALSSEVIFDQLLEKLMKFVIENAGAQAGYFILDWSGKLYIEARQSVSDEKSVKLKIPLEISDLIPKTIVEYVFRLKKDVVLTDAQLDPVFSNDPIVIKKNVRSALCIPAVNQGKLVGALYLENNLTSGAFTKDRVELLKLLSGQIAVSIENSILYENLEQKVQERTAEIQVQKEEIERQKQLVEQKSKFKEQFFANMSHEIRTPMTAIIGMSELIFDTQLTLQQMEYAKGIKYSSENLLAIINDILDFSKIEAGKFSFVQKPFQIRERMHRLHAMVRVLAEEKRVILSMDVAAPIPDQLIGDPLRLHQILLNLVGNAIKFTEQGNVWITVNQIEANESHVILSFAVRDSGIGIAEDKLNFIFETFSRIEDELNLQHTGTGLGLFIAKKLVEEQGGSMTVTSRLKEGTTFQFTLPFQRCDALAQEEEKDAISLSDTRVLLVEDTLFNQVVAEEILKKIIRNAQVVVAENGLVALEKLEQHTVDIVLMDIKMPVMDGYTASRRIRSIKGLETIPILAFTSNANPGEADKCKEAGMDDYITKPIESKKLKQKIAKLLHASAAPVQESGW